jgi:hypothetical protein
MTHGKILIVQLATIMGAWYGLDAYLYSTDGFTDNPAFGVVMATVLLFGPHLWLARR